MPTVVPQIVWQKFHPIPGGTVCITQFRKTGAATETVSNYPMMKDQSNSVVQLRMNGDAASTITQTTDRNGFTITGAARALVTVVSIHNAPVVHNL
jgi:hypothetical protein